MSRYFIEVGYKGTNYAGFQKQDNANTIQSEVEKALRTYFRTEINLTGSSRTDAGVHARQNFFHFDIEEAGKFLDFNKSIYHLNAILPLDIVVRSIKLVTSDAHCRFDAKARTYEYIVYQGKDPFMNGLGYFYPYVVDLIDLQHLAGEIIHHTNFQSFAKRNTQVHTFNCSIYSSDWVTMPGYLLYRVKANRFLRGMVKGLVGTMLRAASNKHSIEQFRSIILSQNPSKVDFAVPSHGLTLVEVSF
jgi:tRNA pseudouridine38-40 synthase